MAGIVEMSGAPPSKVSLVKFHPLSHFHRHLDSAIDRGGARRRGDAPPIDHLFNSMVIDDREITGILKKLLGGRRIALTADAKLLISG
ncbi:hypothetical protein IHQ72_35880 (plasmid) [Mesorhizobium onobrychidis]|uniref:Uncharacterized protein n=2 Tax=Mesorhizobium onobrychidis TaxID=2775404 RepID=A0ABY5R803_9HYPH|nr:hypothetical protein IHQ72_35880 [Mesorhizobium onobrychidis]